MPILVFILMHYNDQNKTQTIYVYTHNMSNKTHNKCVKSTDILYKNKL